VVNNGDPEVTRRWAAEVQARFPVLAQERFSLSRRYEVYATPFAFVIDEQGVITSKGIINNGQHVGHVLSGARDGAKEPHGEPERNEQGDRSACARPSGHEPLTLGAESVAV